MTCKLCGSPTHAVYMDYPGYKAPARFTIRHCPACDTSFADPCRVDPEVYDLIYKHAEHVPGYDRYKRYARVITRQRNPLKYLASQEDVYWAIREYFRDPRATQGRTLEIGSGLGYLTFALARSGIHVTGLDISPPAVETATRRFGRLFRCADVGTLAQTEEETYDTIVMTEVLEHVSEPVELVESCLKLLRPQGRVLITTPNKSFFAPEARWRTDSPPVHLWWFSELSFEKLAQRLHLSVEYIDFVGYNKKQYPIAPPLRADVLPPVFDENGTLIWHENRLKSFLRTTGLMYPAFRLACRLAAMRNFGLLRRSPQMRRETLALTLGLARRGRGE